MYFSIFHAVSAFCNAGFDLFGHFSSLTAFQNEPLVLLTISVLIVLGGTGFAVLGEVTRQRFQWRELSLHSRLVLGMTGVLLLMGMTFFCLTEWHNPATLGGISGAGNKIVNALMQSTTMRTAGFNSVDLASMRQSSKLMSIILMFIGRVARLHRRRRENDNRRGAGADGLVGHPRRRGRAAGASPRSAGTDSPCAGNREHLAGDGAGRNDAADAAGRRRAAVPRHDVRGVLRDGDGWRVQRWNAELDGGQQNRAGADDVLRACRPLTMASALASRQNRNASKIRYPEEEITIG